MRTNKGGRPQTTLDDLPENWKEQILHLCSEGKSEVQIRAHFAKINGTFSIGLWYALKEREKEFLETLKIGKDLCQAWWEDIAQNNIVHEKGLIFETGSWSMNMKNRFKWTDRVDASVDIGENAEEYFKIIADSISKADTNTD